MMVVVGVMVIGRFYSQASLKWFNSVWGEIK